jgi:16S rRNA (cytosine1402-N4)-methyltransferase
VLFVEGSGLSYGAHIPVLLEEAISGLAIQSQGIYLDATYGRGGHSAAILDALGESGRLIAMDKDPDAQQQAREHFANESRFELVAADFSAAESVVAKAGLTGQLSGVLIDLGVSSPQLDRAERGFSFNQDGPLDMRMDPTSGQSAKDWLATADLREMVRVFKEFGEERYAPRIARALVAQREQHSIESTLQLAEIVKHAHPKWEKGKHPATRVFQAIRIHVNSEMDALRGILSSASTLLASKGRLVVISFHSLEDRMVKQFMRSGFNPIERPRGLPVEFTSDHPFKPLGKPIYAGEAELARNVRARSAVLRVAEKCT